MGEEYWHRMLQGPYVEKFSKALDCAHMGIYRNGKREEWGKMVSSITLLVHGLIILGYKRWGLHRVWI